jgi:hypothetical protein
MKCGRMATFEGLSWRRRIQSGELIGKASRVRKEEGTMANLRLQRQVTIRRQRQVRPPSLLPQRRDLE